MDVFSLLMAVVIMLLAFQYNQIWIVFIVVAAMIVWFRNLHMTLILLAVAAALYFGREVFDLQSVALPILIALVIFAVLALLLKKKEPEYFPSDLYGMGGLGGM